MRHDRHGLIFFVLTFLLAGVPCLAGTPTPGGTMPDLQSVAMADITVAPIAYQGPILSDIGMKLITYEGPELTDITVNLIQFGDKTLTIANKPTLKQANGPSAMSTSIALVPKLIPGVQPGLKILSPKPGQTFTGSVPLEVEITGWQGIPRVDLDWWWSAPTPAGQWPATPQGMTVVNHLDGKTRILIPASTFPKSGLWRVKASVKMSDHQQVIDDVSFTLSGMLKPTSKTGVIKLTPKQTTPSVMPTHPAAPQKVQPLPATPGGKTITPAN
ncbi:MAG: hypothetical protein HF981_26130 [Desulfobacteraceae bacterium]|nr:hypothetical protein [Desulfobacteraceae bacterium]MBC2753899.1 hypothetical protein [Desulfobacteraceae bacterium]